MLRAMLVHGLQPLQGITDWSLLYTPAQLCFVQGAADWHPAPKPVLEAAAEARRAGEAHGVDIGTLAIKESVAAPGVAVHLMGMKTVEEVSALPCFKKFRLSRAMSRVVPAVHLMGMKTVKEVSALPCFKLCRQSRALFRAMPAVHLKGIKKVEEVSFLPR